MLPMMREINEREARGGRCMGVWDKNRGGGLVYVVYEAPKHPLHPSVIIKNPHIKFENSLLKNPHKKYIIENSL